MFNLFQCGLHSFVTTISESPCAELISPWNNKHSYLSLGYLVFKSLAAVRLLIQYCLVVCDT
jgi:hypothetical protein